MKSALEELSTEQRAAIVEFRERFGRKWKSELQSGWMRAAYPGALQQIRNQFGPEWLIKVKESDFTKDNVGTSLNGPQSLPEMCFIFMADAEPGSYVRAVKRGESGSFATTYDVTDPDKAKVLVAHVNSKLGVDPIQAECMLAGSMFGWDSPGADPVKMRAVFQERAEALGYSSAEEMFESQLQTDQRNAAWGAALAYQKTPEAASRKAAAAQTFNIPESSIAFVEPPEGSDEAEEIEHTSFRP